MTAAKFWRIIAGVLSGAMFTMVAAGWMLSGHLTSLDNRVDSLYERLDAHMVQAQRTDERIAAALETLRDIVVENGKYGAAFKARQDDMTEWQREHDRGHRR